MSKQTNIAWCDSTINFWSGCTKVSSGCKNCYAETRDKRMMIEKVSHWGKGAPRLKHKGAVKDALALNRKPWICDFCGVAFAHHVLHDDVDGKGNWINRYDKPAFHRRRIFSLSLGDWLDEEVPIEWLAEMLDTIRQCDQVIWILCTKRPENFTERTDAVLNYHGQLGLELLHFWLRSWQNGNAPKNIILLTSVEDQKAADERIPELLKIPAACRGLSVEPMLGPVDFGFTNGLVHGQDAADYALGWVIFGGESGSGARACNVDWIRGGVKQCQVAGVPVFVKQLGAFALGPMHMLNGPDAIQRLQFKDKKGGDMTEWPEELRVREFPEVDYV